MTSHIKGIKAQTLARLATRAELRQPGILERRLSAPGAGGSGLGGMFASSLMGSVVGSVIGSAIAHQFMGGFGHAPMDTSGDQVASADDSDTDTGDTDTGNDSGDDLGGDIGGDDLGSDL